MERCKFVNNVNLSQSCDQPGRFQMRGAHRLSRRGYHSLCQLHGHLQHQSRKEKHNLQNGTSRSKSLELNDNSILQQACISQLFVPDPEL